MVADQGAEVQAKEATMSDAQTAAHAAHDHPAIAAHAAHGHPAVVHTHTPPSPWVYLSVAGVLTVITIIEVAVYYIELLRPVLAPILLILSASKFALVALFYMHLRFDSRLFAAFFVAGLGIAAALTIAFLHLFPHIPQLVH